MELEQFYGMNYKGSRRFTQGDAHSAHAPGFRSGGNDHGNSANDLNSAAAGDHYGAANGQYGAAAGEHYRAANDQYGAAAGGHYPATGDYDPAAGDPNECGVDLNEQLIRNKAATFFMRVSSDAMTGAGIFHGDVVIVDRSVKAASGKVVIAVLNGEMLIRRLEKTFNKLRLVPETPRLSPIDIDLSGAEFSIWGVVTYVIHAL
jgi:DNA polymerase V